jgi:hypothetical protein
MLAVYYEKRVLDKDKKIKSKRRLKKCGHEKNQGFQLPDKKKVLPSRSNFFSDFMEMNGRHTL